MCIAARPNLEKKTGPWAPCPPTGAAVKDLSKGKKENTIETI